MYSICKRGVGGGVQFNAMECSFILDNAHNIKKKVLLIYNFLRGWGFTIQLQKTSTKAKNDNVEKSSTGCLNLHIILKSKLDKNKPFSVHQGFIVTTFIVQVNLILKKEQNIFLVSDLI